MNINNRNLKTITGDPQLMRQINQGLVLNLLRNHKELSRTQIAELSLLSKPTISRVINDLLDNDIVIETREGNSASTGGRKPVMITLNSKGRYVVGVDLGTTNTVVAMANLKGEIIKKKRVPTNRNHSVENILTQVSSMVNEIINESGISRDLIEGLGVSEAGVVEKETGIIKFSPNFNWKNVNISDLLQEKTRLKTIADNCTRVMAKGEMWYNTNSKINNLFYVNVGYGIGSSLVINGQVYNNYSEFGHIPITEKNIKCNCGKTGCLEAVASGNSIEKKANQLYSDSNSWLTAKDVFKKAKNGDKIAIDLFSETGYFLGKGISIVANIFNPDKIIIGGGVSLAGDLLLDPIRKEFDKNAMKMIKETTKIENSSLGIEAGVYGAISMVLNHFIFYDSIFK